MFYIFIALIIFFGEWKLKNYIEAHYDVSTQKLILKNKIRIRKYHNHGAFFNILETRRRLLHFISILFTMLIFIFLLFTLFQKGNGLLKLGLSFLLGGAFSNTYDRLSRDYVVDYFSFCSPFPRFNRIVFNISDFCIMMGALTTALRLS